MSEQAFEYLLNAMEDAGAKDNPVAHHYADKRRAVLDFVTSLRRRLVEVEAAALALSIKVGATVDVSEYSGVQGAKRALDSLLSAPEKPSGPQCVHGAVICQSCGRNQLPVRGTSPTSAAREEPSDRERAEQIAKDVVTRRDGVKCNIVSDTEIEHVLAGMRAAREGKL